MTGDSLVGALPETITAYNALVDIAAEKGITFRIAEYGGLRTKGDTATILAYRDADWKVYARNNPIDSAKTTKEAWRPIAQWGHSMHNYGAAFDVEVTGVPVGMSNLAALNFLKDQAQAIGCNDGRDFGDPPHFEIAFDGAAPGAQALAAAKARWQALNGTPFFHR